MSSMKRGRRFRFIVLIFRWLLLCFPMTARADSPFALRDGDRVVFYGDEVTAVQFYDNPLEPRIYTTFIEAYAITRFPKLHFEFANSGWNGDRVSGGAGGPIDVRLERDVIAYKPTVLTVMLGMNDAWMTTFDPKRFDAFTISYEHRAHPELGVFDSKRFEAFTTGYQHLIETVKSAVQSIRVTLLKPIAYEDPQVAAISAGQSNVMLQYGRRLDEIGERDHLTVVDPNPALAAVIKQAADAEPNIARQMMIDDAHPGAAGHLVIAEAVLKAWHAPAVVSAVEIDGRMGRIVRVENTRVGKITKAAGALSWTQTDNALPFLPNIADPAVALAVRTSDIAAALDQQMLKLTGLSAAKYELRIDGEMVDWFAAEQLAGGINLAILNTPMRRQATRVFDLVRERDNVHFGRWRWLEFPLRDISLTHKLEALSAFDALEKDLVAEQYAAAKPTPHRYDLVPL